MASRRELVAKVAERLANWNRQKAQVPKAKKQLDRARKALERFDAEKAKAARQVWHPDAERVLYASAGAFAAGAKPRIVWHTTETVNLPRYSGSAPHFTFDPKTGRLWQHMPIDESARALLHPAGTVETNRARAIQVELLGYAKDTGVWPAADYARIAGLARWIERNAGVPRTCGVAFTVPAARIADGAWLGYSGHCGHAHVPHNDHWDPGRFRIQEVLG